MNIRVNKEAKNSNIDTRVNELTDDIQEWCGLVPYFGCHSLNTDPNFGRYWKFCDTIIDAHTNRNPYKRGTTHQIRQRRGV